MLNSITNINFHEKELKDELDAIEHMYFKAGEELIRVNSYIKVIPFLVTGLIGVYRMDEEGREILLYYIKPGETCIMSFLAGINNNTIKLRAVIEEDCELIIIPVDKVIQWVKKYPEWVDYIFKLYNKRFEDLLEVVNAIAFQKMDERIFQNLQKKSEMSEKKEISITHQQLADEIGTTREVVSRLLKKMERDGLLSLGRNKIVLM